MDDVGRVINPLICEGQIQGGLAQGIGQALFEEVAYDRASGQLLSGNFTEYCMPRSADLPSFTLGCGTYGGNSTTDNVSYHNLLNIKRLAHLVATA